MTIGGGILQHRHTGASDGGTRLSSHKPPGFKGDYFGTGTPGSNADDWLQCIGQNVSRVTYAALFAAIGTTWGIGDGSTTFTLPDARRRATVGSGGTGSAALGNAVGNTGGTEAAQLIDHTHGIQAIANTVGGNGPQPLGGNASGGIVTGSTNSAGSSTASAYCPVYVCSTWIKT